MPFLSIESSLMSLLEMIWACVYEDSKYRQMALINFDTQTTELGL